ncbi:MAG: LysR substrate-binding domain-containing protein [Methyloligellaceae bacterium]
MNLRQLECFRAVMVSGTMTRAAELLGISQPSVSNIIAGMERELGFQLFKRRKGRLLPTAEASYFFEEANRTLESLDRAVQIARELRKLNAGRLVLATQPGLSIHFLPAVVSEFLRTHPDVRFKLLSRSSDIVRDMIPAQQFDLAIAELPAQHPAVRTETVSLRCVCVLPEAHPLAAKKVIRPTDLDDVPFISLYKEHATVNRLSRLLAEADATWKVVAETQFFSTCCAFAQHGAGVTVSDPFTASRYAGAGAVVRSFEPEVRYEFGILYPRDRPTSALVEAFSDLLKTRFMDDKGTELN